MNKTILVKEYYANNKNLIIATILSIISVVLYYVLSGDIPILHGFSDSDSEISMHEARRQITYAHRNGQVNYFGQGYFKYLFLNILPICSFWYYFKNKINNTLQKKHYFLLIFCAISQILDSRLIPIGRFFIFFFLTKILVEHIYIKKIKISKIFTTIIVAFSFIYILFTFQSSQRLEKGTSENAFVNRLFLIPTGKLYIIFPDDQPFRYGETWKDDILGFLPGASENFRFEVHQIIYGGSHGFTLSPTFFGSTYVNFGVWGLIIFSFIFGYIVNNIGAKILNYKSVMAVILYASFSTMIMYSCVSDVVTVIVPIVTIFVIQGIFQKKIST